jgi:hypothetical protein
VSYVGLRCYKFGVARLKVVIVVLDFQIIYPLECSMAMPRRDPNHKATPRAQVLVQETLKYVHNSTK